MAAPALERITPSAVGQPQLWLALWMAGAVGLVLVVGFFHFRFRAALTRRGRLWRLPAGCSAAWVGLWQPRLALPIDFRQRFNGQERRLVLDHERVHAQRGDNFWSLLAFLYLALQWFNPLAWWCMRRFLADQELACDAAVLRRQPGAERHYAQALLKAQSAQPVGAFASAYSSHPLVERIRMLPQHKAPSRRFALLVAIVCSSGATYALQGSAPLQLGESKLSYRIEVLVNGEAFGPMVLIAKAKEAAVVRFQSKEGGEHQISVTGEIQDDRSVAMELVVSRPSALAAPFVNRYVLEPGKRTRIQRSDPSADTLMDIQITPSVIQSKGDAS
jgi:hypothetical protein